MTKKIYSTDKSAQATDSWTNVDSNPPPHFKKILVYYKNRMGNGRIVMAEKYKALTVECQCDYDCDCDYDEKRDCYYIPPGWWEVSENHEEFQLVRIENPITHWHPLPKMPNNT